MNSIGRVAIVTGAGSGIGRAVAVALGAKGYRIALGGRRVEALEESAALVRAAGGEALVAPADVRDSAVVDALFERAISTFGRVDLLFNNAGAYTAAVPIDEVSDDAWRDMVDVNLTGAFYCMRAAFRAMKAQTPRGGRIINNGSISAHAPRPNSAAYTATKHAMTGLTKSGSLDGRAFDIACGQIDIGNAGTEMTSRIAAGARQADGSLKAEPVFDVRLVGEAVVYMDSLPLDANVQFMTLMATTMPFVGRG